MPYPQRLLAEDEEIVLDLHPHWKQLVVPLLLIPVVCGVASYVAFILPDDGARPALRWAIAVVAVLILLRFSLWPYLKWQTTHYVLTTRRVPIVVTTAANDHAIRRCDRSKLWPPMT